MEPFNPCVMQFGSFKASLRLPLTVPVRVPLRVLEGFYQGCGL